MTKIRKSLSNNRLTEAARRRLEKIAEMPDEQIDNSEIPELTDQFWRNAVRNPFYRPVKRQLTLRLDADVIAWLRRQGRGYQTRANALLRKAMIEDVRSRSRVRRGGRVRSASGGVPAKKAS